MENIIDAFIMGAVPAAIIAGVPMLYKLGKQKKIESINNGKVYYGLLYYRIFVFYLVGVMCGEMILLMILGNSIKGIVALLLTLLCGVPFAILFFNLYKNSFIKKHFENSNEHKISEEAEGYEIPTFDYIKSEIPQEVLDQCEEVRGDENLLRFVLNRYRKNGLIKFPISCLFATIIQKRPITAFLLPRCFQD